MSETRLLTIATVCDRLSLSRAKVAALLASGELRSLSIGRARRIREEELDRFIAERAAEHGGGPETGATGKDDTRARGPHAT